MVKKFTIWNITTCPKCHAVAFDLSRFGKLEYKDLAELKANPPKITDENAVEIDVLTQLQMQNDKAPVVAMGGKVLTETELLKARRGEF